MDNQEAVTAGAQPRSWSLRREWSRAFAIMLALLLVASIATFAGVRRLVSEFSGTAHQLDRESTVVALLRASLNDHEDRAHALLAATPVNRPAFVRQQNDIVVAFDNAITTFHTRRATTDLQRAERSWQAALTRVGLWGERVKTFTGPRPDLQAPLGSDSDKARAALDGLQSSSLDGLRSGLARDTDLERLLLAVLAAFGGLGIVVIVYFRRRMSRDVLRPVAGMHTGVLELQAGEYDHRISVFRHDELGELAEAFNVMADALRDSHEALTLRATRDSLTGLGNRAALLERLAASLGPGSDRRARRESMLFIDIDDFKDVNDSVGHDGGDGLLNQLGARLNDCVRPHDLVARMGGDEFAIVVVEDDGGATAVDVAERILTVLRAPFIVGGTRLIVSVSIGIAQKHREITDARELLRRADFAMYMAKGAGKGCYRVFDGVAHDLVGH